jgi:L-ribulose-5-phosphate 3-epimerase|tara:strand:+ start:929 stop:1753 length:825 start_codon:yes stop_codon:yes gene_type:complete
MKNLFGTMQGRLLPKYKGQYQSHPKNYWQEEFLIASDLGLDCIEFIFDFEDYKENPLFNESGIREIKEISKSTDIKVVSVCADFFIKSKIHSLNPEESNFSKEVLVRLIKLSSEINIKNIILPCVEVAALSSEKIEDIFISEISSIINILEDFDINLSLETDLPPNKFANLLSNFKSKKIRVNYDIGNSASFGYSAKDELDAYGHKISDIHIKDRKFNGGPIILGEGNADFNFFFNYLKKFNYTGPFIMQAFRDEEGIDIFKKQQEWIKPYLNL